MYNIGEVPEQCTHWQLLLSRMTTMIMHFYIIKITTFFIKVEALKFFYFLQEDNFHQWNLDANSDINTHLILLLKYHRSISEYIQFLWCYIRIIRRHIEYSGLFLSTSFIMSQCHICDFFQVPPSSMEPIEVPCNLFGSMGPIGMECQNENSHCYFRVDSMQKHNICF